MERAVKGSGIGFGDIAGIRENALPVLIFKVDVGYKHGICRTRRCGVDKIAESGKVSGIRNFIRSFRRAVSGKHAAHSTGRKREKSAKQHKR